MKPYKINGFTIYKGNAAAEPIYRKELSQILLNELGKGPYSDHEIARKAVTKAYNYYCDKFIELCHSETSVRFYQFVLSQHEQAVEVALFAERNEYPVGIDKEYVAVYRRVLKWILEQACDIKLLNQENTDDAFLKRTLGKLNELWFLGDMIFSCAYYYAEQDMIEDVMEVVFDSSDQYVFQHKHHYDFVVDQIQQSYGAHSIKHVVDEKAVPDLKADLEKCFGIKYEYCTSVIAAIHKANESRGGQYVGFGWESLPLSAEAMFGANPDQARIFFKGLTLSKTNKLNLHELACKPNSMFRYMYRPITIWNIEGEDFAVVGKKAFSEAIIQLSTNCIPWGKAPDEWMVNACFKNYVHSKEDEHDTWLDDEVESRLKAEGLKYHRNITSIKGQNVNINLLQNGVGEIDFIIVNHAQKMVHVVDSKHLQGRYDMMTQKNDFSNFTKIKGYNEQIKRKLDFVTLHLPEIDHHNKAVFGAGEPSIVSYKTDGFFIINTPTFYMFNSDYRIYTVDVFIDLIAKKLKDPIFDVVVENSGKAVSLQITYPYFKKPSYKLADYLNSES